MQPVVTREPWNEAYALHAESLRRFAARRIRGVEEAEDVVQEAFARVLRRSPELEDASSLRAYLFATVRNLLVNRLRGSRTVLFCELSDDGGEPWTDRVADRSVASPDERPLERELDSGLRKAFAALPERQRRAFREAVIEGKPYRQVAAEQGWSLEQVKINVFRARQGLIARLGCVLGGKT
jgi:RNA polymerase sigma-70 factor (ECF subfamily)